jgi:hypothetical protein
MPVACRYALRKQAIRALGPVQIFSGDHFTPFRALGDNAPRGELSTFELRNRLRSVNQEYGSAI